MAKKVAVSKPFSPTVHVLVIPTQLPLDMQHAFRDLDESEMVRLTPFECLVYGDHSHQNEGSVPDHMNILSTNEAIEHVSALLFSGCSFMLLTDCSWTAAYFILGAISIAR
jgi:hypothetical protein